TVALPSGRNRRADHAAAGGRGDLRRTRPGRRRRTRGDRPSPRQAERNRQGPDRGRRRAARRSGPRGRGGPLVVEGLGRRKRGEKLMLAALTSRLGLGIIGVGAIIAALLLATNLGKAHGTIKSLKADLVSTNEAWGECRADLAIQQAQNLELRGALDVQNAAVQDWKRKAERVQAEA